MASAPPPSWAASTPPSTWPSSTGTSPPGTSADLDALLSKLADNAADVLTLVQQPCAGGHGNRSPCCRTSLPSNDCPFLVMQPAANPQPDQQLFRSD